MLLCYEAIDHHSNANPRLISNTFKNHNPDQTDPEKSGGKSID